MDNSKTQNTEEEKLLEAPQEEPLLEAPEEEKLIPAHTGHNPKATVIKILLGFVGALILVAIAYTTYTLFSSTNQSNFVPPAPVEITTPPEESVVEIQSVCTMDARVCPDGSSVGRTGPNCEFAPCPGE